VCAVQLQPGNSAIRVSRHCCWRVFLQMQRSLLGQSRDCIWSTCRNMDIWQCRNAI
jgi:hypothetical protein